ncbi:SMC-Scp complex subunit ScpB [Planctomicrobium sp. SH527]|uniref:SMC-Scp complex subunit ScpB n=1 Tax=Planctomicrobium sp. SH527 TaxID=3448123 RepID=UPI003F5CB0DA
MFRLLRDRLTRGQGETAQGWRWRRRLSSQSVETLAFQPTTAIAIRTPKMARLEAALFVADSAQSARKLAQIAMLSDAREAISLIDQLNESYDTGRSTFRIERVAAGYRLLTRSEYSPWLDRLHERQARLKLSSPLMEALAIIAYRQPCTRAEVESVRGVQSAEILKQLMERNLVRVTGEDDSLGRPYLYGTTRLFLETFGLTELTELPWSARLRRATPADATESATDGDSGDSVEAA